MTRPAHRTRGSTIVEFAFIVPLFLLLLMGLLEGGRLVFTWSLQAEAAREGTRTAILPDSTEAAVKTRALRLAGLVGVTGGEITVSRNGGAFTAPATRGDQVGVSISHNFMFLVGTMTGGSDLRVLPTTIPITTSAVMRAEG